MESQDIQSGLCTNCQNSISPDNKFCRICGTAQNQEHANIHFNKWPNLQHIALFFGVEILWCIASLLIGQKTIAVNISFDIGMAITAVLFFAGDWQENKHLLKWPNFSFIKLSAFVSITIITSIIVQYLVGHLNQAIFKEDLSYYSSYNTHQYGKYIMIVSVALFPAIFEELAYRGYLMQKLLGIVDRKEAIYITSILFFLIHFSLISFFWMLPFALLLAYVRIKEKTLWYGIFIHFFFNLTTCLVEIFNITY